MSVLDSPSSPSTGADAAATPATDPVGDRVRQLSAASERRFVDPMADIAGRIDLSRQIIPDELLSTHELDVELTDHQKMRLAREEVASGLHAGVRFEAVLNAGFSAQIAQTLDLTDPRVTFMLHEVGEETRHQRVFIDVIRQLEPVAPFPLDLAPLRVLERWGLHRIWSMPALLNTLILAGEEAPDRVQKLAADHPETDPHLAAVARYHRAEEARHLGFARAVMPEIWETAGRRERVAVRRVAPQVISDMIHNLWQPGIYATVDLPMWATWRAARVTSARQQFRRDVTRPVLQTLLDAGVFFDTGVTSAWQSLCDVDAEGDPLPTL